MTFDHKKFADEFEAVKWQVLLEGCVWRAFREALPIGVPEEGAEFLVLTHEKVGDMTAKVTTKGKELHFEVKWGEDTHSFKR